MNVVRLIDHAPIACWDQQELLGWLKDWVEALESGRYGEFRSLMLVAEQDTTVAITRPTADTSPVPAVVEMSKTEAAKVDPDVEVSAKNVQVKAPAAKPGPKPKK